MGSTQSQQPRSSQEACKQRTDPHPQAGWKTSHHESNVWENKDKDIPGDKRMVTCFHWKRWLPARNRHNPTLRGETALPPHKPLSPLSHPLVARQRRGGRISGEPAPPGPAPGATSSRPRGAWGSRSPQSAARLPPPVACLVPADSGGDGTLLTELCAKAIATPPLRLYFPTLIPQHIVGVILFWCFLQKAPRVLVTSRMSQDENYMNSQYQSNVLNGLHQIVNNTICPDGTRLKDTATAAATATATTRDSKQT